MPSKPMPPDTAIDPKGPLVDFPTGLLQASGALKPFLTTLEADVRNAYPNGVVDDSDEPIRSEPPSSEWREQWAATSSDQETSWRARVAAEGVDFDALMTNLSYMRSALTDPRFAERQLETARKYQEVRLPSGDVRETVGSIQHLLKRNADEHVALMMALGDCINFVRMFVGKNVWPVFNSWTGYSEKYLMVTALIARTWLTDEQRAALEGIHWSKIQRVVFLAQKDRPIEDQQAAQDYLDAAKQGATRADLADIIGEDTGAYRNEAGRSTSGVPHQDRLLAVFLRLYRLYDDLLEKLGVWGEQRHEERMEWLTQLGDDVTDSMVIALSTVINQDPLYPVFEGPELAQESAPWS